MGGLFKLVEQKEGMLKTRVFDPSESCQFADEPTGDPPMEHLALGGILVHHDPLITGGNGDEAACWIVCLRFI
jgi:hypothetical protein